METFHNKAVFLFIINRSSAWKVFIELTHKCMKTFIKFLQWLTGVTYEPYNVSHIVCSCWMEQNLWSTSLYQRGMIYKRLYVQWMETRLHLSTYSKTEFANIVFLSLYSSTLFICLSVIYHHFLVLHRKCVHSVYCAVCPGGRGRLA